MAKVSTSGYEALTADFTRKRYHCCKQIQAEAKHALLMAEAGYTQPIHRTDVKAWKTSIRYVLSRN
jgi:3-hydroxyacyl-CoA dehydrogenase